MGLLAPKRRIYHRWRTVLPLYDGKECPDCGVPVLGREARRIHREEHMRRQEWEQWVENTVRQIATFAGMTVLEAEEKRAGGDEYGRVDLAGELPGDDEEDDDDED
jgi:hypothetical protein